MTRFAVASVVALASQVGLTACRSVEPDLPLPPLPPCLFRPDIPSDFPPPDCGVLVGHLVVDGEVAARYVTMVLWASQTIYSSNTDTVSADGIFTLDIIRLFRVQTPTTPDTVSIGVRVYRSPEAFRVHELPIATPLVRVLFTPLGMLADTTRANLEVQIKP